MEKEKAIEATQFMSQVVPFMDSKKRVYVIIYERDFHGCVINAKRYPVANVFAHNENEVKIVCEEDEVTQTQDF